MTHTAQQLGQTQPNTDELRSRLAFMMSPASSPIRELRWWTSTYGEAEGLSRLTATLLSALRLHIDEHLMEPFQSERSEQFLEMLCLWLEHIICAKQLLNILRDTASWPESTVIAKQRIRSATDAEPQRVCSRSFRAGDIVWNCKQCQKDTTCVLCQQCFRDSDHEGHDVYFYHVMTDAGGCCDCGDPGAWNPRGFCTRHGGGTADPVRWLPEDISATAKVVVAQVVRCIAGLASAGRAELVLEAVPEQLADPAVISSTAFKDEVKRLYEYISRAASHQLRPKESRDEMGVPILLKSWFVKVENCIRSCSAKGRPTELALEEDVDQFVLAAITLSNLENCRRVVRDLRGNMFFRLVAKNASSIRISYFTERLASWLLTTLCVDSDAFSRIACQALTEAAPADAQEREDEKRIGCTLTPLKRLIVQDLQLPDSCSKALRSLYIRLLVDGLFKQRFAIAFAKTYRECAMARIKRLPVLEMSDVDTIFGLSVQFLNRPNHVLLLVHDHGFLLSILRSLQATVKYCERPSANDASRTELDLLSTVLTHRKTKCLVTDFQYVLNTPGMSRYLLGHDPQYLSMWFSLLDTVYGMHTQTRIVAPGLPEKDERWIPAFNLSLSLLSLFSDLTRYLMFGEPLAVDATELEFETTQGRSRTLVLNTEDDKKSHGNWCHGVLTRCVQHVGSILDKRAPAADSIVQVESLFGTHPYIAYDVSSQPVTFHCLLQRFFATLQALCVASTLVADEYEGLLHLGSLSFWLRMMRQPLNALILFAQSNASMWARNEDVASQAMNYQSLPFISGMSMDIRVLQMASLALPPDVLVSYVVHAFDLIDWIGLAKTRPTAEPPVAATEPDSVEATAAAAAAAKLRARFSADRAEVERNGRTQQQSEKLASAMLELLCVMVTELPPATPFALKRALEAEGVEEPKRAARLSEASDRILRREIVHTLAIKRSTFSMINDNCTHLKQVGVEVSASNIRRVLADLASEISRTDGMGPIQFDLKAQSWSEFDPLFHRLARNEKDQARERWLQHRVSPPIEKACFPGDTKPKSSATRTAPLPATTWHSNIHPAFQGVRSKLLSNASTFLLVRQVLVKICCEDPSPARPRSASEAAAAAQGKLDSDSAAGAQGEARAPDAAPAPAPQQTSSFSVHFLSNALHLLTLQFHQLRAKCGDDYGKGATSGEDDAGDSAAAPAESGEGGGGPMAPPAEVGSLPWFTSKLLAKDPVHGESVLSCLLRFWYNEPRIDETNRENVRWLLAEACKMDARVLSRVRKAYKSKKSALQAEKEKLSRKRKAQRHAMNSMRQSQELAFRALAKEMDLDTGDGAGVDDANELSPNRRRSAENDSKKTKLRGGPGSDSDEGASDAGGDGTASVGTVGTGLPFGTLNQDSTSHGFGSRFSNLVVRPRNDSVGLSAAAAAALAGLPPSSEMEMEGVADEADAIRLATHQRGDTVDSVVGHSGGAGVRGGDDGMPAWKKHALVERQLWRGPECVSCHERHRVEDGPTCFIGFRQKNDALVREKAETTKHGFCVYWPEAAGRNYVIQLCGHAIHSKCLDRYRSSIQNLPASAATETDKNEFLCPLCKTLSNFEMPCIPPSLVYVPRPLSSDNVGAGADVLQGSQSAYAHYHQQAEDNSAALGLGGRAAVLDQCMLWFARHANLSPRTSQSKRSAWGGLEPPTSANERGAASDRRGNAGCMGSSALDGFLADDNDHGDDSVCNEEDDGDDGCGQGGARVAGDFAVAAGELVDFSSKQLEPLSESLRTMANKKDHKGNIPFGPKFNFHSEQGRLREIQTMVLLDRRETPHHQFSEDPISIVFSVALTFVAECEAAGFDRAQAPTLSTNTVKRIKRMFEACRAYLLVDEGSGLNHLTSEMFEMFSDKRSPGYHCVLHQSPEMLLVLSVLRDCSPENVMQSIWSTYVLKLVQALLELSPEDVALAAEFTVVPEGQRELGDAVYSTGSGGGMSHGGRMADGLAHAGFDSLDPGLEDPFSRLGGAEGGSRGAFGVGAYGDEEEQVGVFQGSRDLRDFLLDKLQGGGAPLCAHAETLTNALVESVTGFVHIAQIVLLLTDQTAPPCELKLVPREKITAYMEAKLRLPCPTELLHHVRLGNIFSDWIDQVLICTPRWMPRATSSPMLGSPSSSSSLDLAAAARSHIGGSSGSAAKQAGRRTAQLGHLRPLRNVRPLTVRPLVKLRDSYTEQYVEVHQGNCGDCKEPAHDRAICLICGEILLAGKKHPNAQTRNVEKGECTQHTEEYHNGIGMVLLFRRSSSVLLINGACSAYWGSLYVDRNGDDQQVIPSLPMYLDSHRYARVLRLWAENNIPSQVASLRNVGNVVIRRNYY